MNRMSNTIPHLLTTLATSYGQLMEAAGCDPYNPTDVTNFIDGVNLPTKIKREIMELYSEPPEDENPLDDHEMIMDDSNIYEVHGFKDREEYLQHLSDDYMVPLDTVQALAEVLGETEDFDGLVTAVQDTAE